MDLEYNTSLALCMPCPLFASSTVVTDTIFFIPSKPKNIKRGIK